MTPPITAVVATRDRGARPVATIESLLASRYPDVTVHVLDQSADERTAEALRPLGSDPRLRYERSSAVGLARAHNQALAAAETELVAITDDDCEVAPDWLERIAETFAIDDRIGIVFGNVRAARHDDGAGFIPAYGRGRLLVAREPRDKLRVEGLGASMAVRRSVWEAVGGFDEMLGAGAPYRAGNEGDLAMRALRAGHWICENPAIVVVHHGFRDWREGRSLLAGYAYGTGAMLAKHWKSGTPGASGLLARLAWRWAFRRPPSALELGHRRHRAVRLGAFVGGFARGVLSPVDRETLRFVDGRGAGAS